MVDEIKKLEQDLMAEIVPLIFDTQRFIQLNTPVDTGRLRGSIVIEEIDNGFIIGTNVEYAEDVELGTPPHLIVPKNKKALKFEINGETVFATRVNHPGTQGSHMFLKGVNFFEKQLSNLKL